MNIINTKIGVKISMMKGLQGLMVLIVSIMLFLPEGTSLNPSNNEHKAVATIEAPYESPQNTPENSTSEFNWEVICANQLVTKIHKVISEEDSIIKYTLLQEIDSSETTICSVPNETFGYDIVVTNSAGETQILINAIPVKDAIEIIDVNLDGYADLQVNTGGTMNIQKELYIWDFVDNKFEKVIYCDFEMLSNYEIHEGFLQNWVKVSASAGVVQHLEWNGNELVNVEEEEYYLEQ